MVKSYRDLDIWDNGMRLAELIYDVTKQFPDSEKYGLVSQLRRASISVPSNIAEGFMRRSTKEYIQFLYISLGSIGEIDTQFELARRFGFAKENKQLLDLITTLRKQLYALIRSLKRKI